MNRLKSILLILTLSATTMAFAQSPAPDQTAAPQHRQPNPIRQTRELTKRLGLTSSQSSQIEPILADRDQRVQTLMADTTLDPKSMHQQRRAIMTDSEQKLNAVLTPTQQQQFAVLRQERHHHGASTGTPPPPAIS